MKASKIRARFVYPCECSAVPECAPGVPLVRDGCGCCWQCARQAGDLCNATHSCDASRNLTCVYNNGKDLSGICRVRSLPTFQNGTYACVSLCPNESLQPSSQCHNPHLVAVAGQCCREWMCDAPGTLDDVRHVCTPCVWGKGPAAPPTFPVPLLSVRRLMAKPHTFPSRNLQVVTAPSRTKLLMGGIRTGKKDTPRVNVPRAMVQCSVMTWAWTLCSDGTDPQCQLVNPTRPVSVCVPAKNHPAAAAAAAERQETPHQAQPSVQSYVAGRSSRGGDGCGWDGASASGRYKTQAVRHVQADAAPCHINNISITFCVRSCKTLTC
ncbi:Protein CYR61 [Chionoecetes opilio]|uniref:Protein CYR61 n=1 Tax=Chionoecetes opilio TaxID=41210 RepID=A0A8J4Y1Z2_CHIOP|nr:Protein CYR61 [Chionoecetes opilio]